MNQLKVSTETGMHLHNESLEIFLVILRLDDNCTSAKVTYTAPGPTMMTH